MKIYKNYCNHNNFRWIGGISIGGGGVLSGKSLTEFGGMTKKLNKILDSVTELILEQNDEIFDVIQIQIVPTKIYTIIGNIGLVRQSKKDGVFEKMNDTPYI